MTNVLNILCQTKILDANQSAWPPQSSVPDVILIVLAFILFVGLAFLIYWLATTSFGKTALDGIPPRRNAMTFYTPLIPVGVWFVLSLIAGAVVDRSQASLDELEQNFVLLGCMGIIAAAVLVSTLFIVKKYFVRGFKGFGLDPRTAGKDFISAAAKLVAVWPLVVCVLWLTVEAGRLINGPNFEIAKHEELEILTEYPQWWVRLTVIGFAVIVAPLYEEVLFRGHVQTGIRNLIHRPWLAIALAAAMFAVVHPNPWHRPALFVLALGLGYAYEKSGSLLQPIFMHAIFNGAMVTATLLQ